MKRGVILIPSMLLLILMSCPASAHKIHVFAYVEGPMIKGEGSLGGGKKAKNAGVDMINNADGTIILTTRTDDHGLFAFPLDAVGQQKPIDILIVLNGGPGHRAEWLLKAEDFVSSDQQNSGSSQVDPASRQNNSGASYPPLKNIISGIICIIGLGALLAYTASRRKKRE
jgi:nickel transport protein